MSRKPKTPEQELRYRRVAELHEYSANARKHSDEQLAKIERSIRRFGFRGALLVTGEGELVAGHGRLEAARRIGLEFVPTIQVDGLDPAELRALRLADNRIAELAEWDETKLATELLELGEIPDLDLEAIGWSEAEIAELAQSTGANVEPDETPADTIARRAPTPLEPPKVAISRTGDVWHLGQHRLACGDCRDAAAVARVLPEKRAELAVADPPYCSSGFQEAARGAGTWGDIAADNLSSRGYAALMRGMIRTAAVQTLYIFTDWRQWVTLFDLVEGAGLAVRSMIVWNKGTPGLGALWRGQHELVMFATRKPSKREKGKPSLGNVLSVPRTGNTNHVTEKPVKLLEQLLEGDKPSGRKSAIVYDPFAGSGSTLLAAEATGRQFAGLEIEPKYVDVIVRRFEAATGKEALLEGRARDTFAKVSRERTK